MLSRMQFKGVWRDYQARILDEMGDHLANRRLHIVAAPGAGKTMLGLEIVRRLGRRALVFAPTVAIRDQWADRLTPLFLDARPAAHEVSHQLSAPRILTLATYQGLDAFRRADEIEELAAALNAEVLGPVQNPRYLLARRSRLGWRLRTDYHAVPMALGAKKASAERFAQLWNQHVGASDLVYARTPQGRRTLLRARAKSLAAGFQRSVDRRSAWT